MIEIEIGNNMTLAVVTLAVCAVAIVRLVVHRPAPPKPHRTHRPVTKTAQERRDDLNDLVQRQLGEAAPQRMGSLGLGNERAPANINSNGGAKAGE